MTTVTYGIEKRLFGGQEGHWVTAHGHPIFITDDGRAHVGGPTAAPRFVAPGHVQRQMQFNHALGALPHERVVTSPQAPNLIATQGRGGTVVTHAHTGERLGEYAGKTGQQAIALHHEQAIRRAISERDGNADDMSLHTDGGARRYLKANFPKLEGLGQWQAAHGVHDPIEHTINALKCLNTDGLSEVDAQIARLALVFHDVGKGEPMPDERRAQYSPEELAANQGTMVWESDHPEASARIAASHIRAATIIENGRERRLTSDEAAMAIHVIRYHDVIGGSIQRPGAKPAFSMEQAADIAYSPRVAELLARVGAADSDSIPSYQAQPNLQHCMMQTSNINAYNRARVSQIGYTSGTEPRKEAVT